MQMRILTMLMFALAALCIAAPAGASDRLVPDSAARMRIVSRAALTFSIEVTNPSDEPTRFDAVGLYFVPDDSGPQRLGVASAPNATMIPPHGTIAMTLQTYCLDEHRAGPSETTHYALAIRRLPTALTNEIAGAAHAPDAQRRIWRIREDMPMPLIGDSRNPPPPTKPTATARDD